MTPFQLIRAMRMQPCRVARDWSAARKFLARLLKPLAARRSPPVTRRIVRFRAAPALLSLLTPVRSQSYKYWFRAKRLPPGLSMESREHRPRAQLATRLTPR